MKNDRAINSIPSLVKKAQLFAAEIDFTQSSLPEVGCLLHVLTIHITQGRIGKIGSGCGIGVAWIVSASHPNTQFITVEIDPYLAASVQLITPKTCNISLTPAFSCSTC